MYAVESPITPIYQQYMQFEPPRRFTDTLQAYISYLAAMGIQVVVPDEEKGPGHTKLLNISMRSFMQSIGMGTGYGTQLKRNHQPSTRNIMIMVEALNKHLDESQRWPLASAMAAAGHFQSERILESAAPIGTSDLMPRAQAMISLPVLDVEAVWNRGLGEAARASDVVLNFTGDMGLIKGHIPGLPDEMQTKGGWILFQRGESTVGTNDAWALLREGRNVVVLPKNQLKMNQVPNIIAWLLGVVRPYGE